MHCQITPEYEQPKTKDKVWVKKQTRHNQKLVISKKSTIFVLSLWNLVKMITSWGNLFHQVSSGLDKNCGFLIDDQCLNACFFYSDLKFYTLIYVSVFQAIPEAVVSWKYKETAINNGSTLVNDIDMRQYYYVNTVTGTAKRKSELFLSATSVDDNGTFACFAQNKAGKAKAEFTLHVVVPMPPKPPQVKSFYWVRVDGPSRSWSLGAFKN